MKNLVIRRETKEDYYNTEHMVMRAFWNLHGPGCNEHLLVHKLRDAEEYLPEFSRVAELDGEIVGLIMYSKAKVVEESGIEHEVVTFGPLCVEPTCISKGVGKRLLEETMVLVKEAGYPAILIFGEPAYYPKHGFVTADHFGITDSNGNNYDAFMAYQLSEDFLSVHGKFYEAAVFEECEDREEILGFNKKFPYYKPLTLSCQWLHKERLGRICEVQKNSFTIKFWEKELPAKLKGSYLKESAEKVPVVGDYVTFQYNPLGDSVILTTCERRSILKRPDQAKTGVEQYMVANADYTFIVSSLNGDYNYNRIARYVSVVLQGDSIPVVILTKSDLCSNSGRYIREVEDISDKVKVHAISALYGIGIEELQEYLQPGNTICLMGSSGVGKSTLINELTGENQMKTGAIREDDAKGRHTTTYRRLLELANGVTVIDTPGMRELGMAYVEDGIKDTFADIVELETMCKFSDCKHMSEPGCAVKQAIEEGTLTRERLELYRNLGKENQNNYAKKKEISKWRKQCRNCTN